MIDAIRDGIRTLLQRDPSLSPAECALIMAVIDNNGHIPKMHNQQPSESRIVRRDEVAKRLGRSKRFVDKLAVEGILTKRKLPGRKRAVGFRAADVERLISEDIT